MCHRDAAFPPWGWQVDPEIALDDVCAKFYFVYISSVHKLIQFHFMCFFSAFLAFLFYHGSNSNNPTETQQSCRAWITMRALHELCRSPETCQEMRSYAYECKLELQSTTAVVLVSWYWTDLSVCFVCEPLMNNVYRSSLITLMTY